MFNGMRVITSEYLVQNETRVERRTWRGRLLSWPWHPLVATRTIVTQAPFQGAVQLDANTLVMHPETLRKMRDMLKNDKEFHVNISVSKEWK